MSSNSSQALVSVIVPTYNYGHLINQALESLAKQTYSRWECIVVDDGSTDNTAEVVKAYSARDPRIRYVHQQNAKQAAARNKGMRHATGEFFQFLDADDLIERQKLERQVDYLQTHHAIDIVYSGVGYFTNDYTDLSASRRYSIWDDGEAWMPEISGCGRVVLDKLMRNNIMVVNAPLVRRRVIEKIGEFDLELTPVEDWDYWTRCAAAGCCFQFSDVEGTRALVRAHERSASLDGRRMMKATLKMRRAWKARTLNSLSDQRLNRNLIAEAEGLLGVEESLGGNRLKATTQLFKAAVLDGRFRPRAKWLVCAALAPFTTGKQLKSVVTTSLTGSIASAASHQR